MAIENVYEPDRYMGDGTQTVFPVSFAFHDVSWLRVTLTSGGADVPLANGTDFTGAIAPGGVGGSVTLAAAPANGATVTVWMDVPRTQPAVLPSTGHFDLKGLERMLDRATLQIQQLAEGVARAVKTAVTSTTTPDQIMTDINAARVDAQASAAGAAASEAAAAGSAGAAGTAAGVAVAARDSAEAHADAAALSASAAAGAASAAIADDIAAHNADVGAHAELKPARVHVESTAQFSITTPNMLGDTGAVANTEGVEIISASITPKRSTSKVRVQATFFAVSVTCSENAAMFLGSTCVAATRACEAGQSERVAFDFEVPSTGAEMAFSLRAGRDAASGTSYVNRMAGGQFFNAADNIISLTLTEVF